MFYYSRPKHVHDMWSILHYIFIMSRKQSLFLFAFLGTSYLLRSVQLCAFGAPHIESADVEVGGIEGSSSKDESSPSPSFFQTSIKFLFCAGGLQLSYLTWAVLQERIVTRTYLICSHLWFERPVHRTIACTCG